MGAFGIWQWLIVLVIVALIFGTKKLRNLGGDLGGAMKNFKDAFAEEKPVPVLLDKMEKKSVVENEHQHTEKQ